MAGSRRLAAIMFTDMVGYTALTQADEASALRLLEKHNGLVRPVLPRYRGREVKTIGDAFLVEFESALDATQCAVEIQRTLHEHNAGVEPTAKLVVRIGIHLGDVVHADGDVFGDAVNLASRVEPLAEPGGICLTAQVFAQVENKIPDRLERLEPQTLKNVRLPVEVYRVVLPWAGESIPSGTAAGGRLAVLPFVNMSPDAADEYFADGMTEELIGKLSEVRGLKVIARTSVMHYKRKEKRLVEIGRELGVDSLIEGSVRRSGQRLRVRVQLVDARSEEHRWAASYDQDLDDIFAIQTDVASKVAGALAKEMHRPGVEGETQDMEAYAAYLRGVRFLHDETPESLRQAVTLLEQAIARDGAFARAHVALARAWGTLTVSGFAVWDDAKERAERAARRALELAPESAEAHAAMSEVHVLLDRFSEAMAEAQRAIEINPNLAVAQESLAQLRTSAGDLAQGVVSYRRAYELDPLSPRIGLNLAWVAQLAGHPDEALRVLTRLEHLFPGDARVVDGLAEFHRLGGDLPRAQEILERGLVEHPGDTALLSDLATNYGLMGRRPEAEEALRRAEAAAGPGAEGASRIYVRAALGDLDAAFETLEQLGETHAWPFILAVHPVFAELRKDARYVAFCEKMGLRL